MKNTKKTPPIFILILLTLFVVVFVFFLYTFLHEMGHVLAGWLFGQSLTEFDLSFWDLSAHVGLAGGELAPSQLAFRSAAGTLLPLLTWVIFISLVPRRGSFLLEGLKLLASMLVIHTLLTWIFLPIVFKSGNAPPDDVTKFLIYSQMPPLLLSALSILFYAGGWMLFLSRIDGLRNEFLIFKQTDLNDLYAGTRRTIPVLSAILVIFVFLTIGANLDARRNSADRFSPPQDFETVSEIDLSSRPYPSESIYQFILDQNSYVGVFISIRNINTTYFDLSVVGPEGASSVVLHGEGYNAAQDGGLWEKSLPPGTYNLVVTSDQSPGTVSVYVRTLTP